MIVQLINTNFYYAIQWFILNESLEQIQFSILFNKQFK